MGDFLRHVCFVFPKITGTKFRSLSPKANNCKNERYIIMRLVVLVFKPIDKYRLLLRQIKRGMPNTSHTKQNHGLKYRKHDHTPSGKNSYCDKNGINSVLYSTGFHNVNVLDRDVCVFTDKSCHKNAFPSLFQS